MADAVVSALAQTVVGNLDSLVLREIGNAWGLTDELNKLKRIFTTIQAIATYEIGKLSEDDSWSLFKQKAFKTEEVDENLVAIGKVIVKKCGGVPLAIKTLGSLMRSKSHESDWIAIKDSEIWRDENGILQALRLSYDNLMPHMRQCFAYCCIFPKDHEMEEIELVQLWMANGFIPSEGQINRLAYRWPFDLQGTALFVMKHETYILESRKALRFPKMLRHLCLDLKSSWEIHENQTKLKLPIDNSLRSLIVHESNVLHRAQAFKHLKEIHLENCIKCEHLPALGKLPSLADLTLDGIDSVKHLGVEWTLPKLLDNPSTLKTLGLHGYTGKPIFPYIIRVSICEKLNPLSGPLRSGVVSERLNIGFCPELKHLPESVQKLSCLKELTIHHCEGLRSLPDWLGSLQSLRELWIGECPDLEKRCQKPNGEDWLTISHIPIILINWKIVQNLDI
ncbi:hypothetical protein BUALT_Bualt18G0052600 [Buddleja alternifolia]|uniref:NB-ARC domain-containing protein n=1 Tax=Buddleja alternifolia TaxID=168488 RepID=A0AAV6W923_9LAMI|nr:hypothetical protein BUALT_Bualt18G0052600 [Buddleja alternifolia]